MRADSDIKRDVEAELKWAPDVCETDIAVKVTSGVVTLTGYALNAYEKYRAEVAVKRVTGVTAVANDLAVRAPLGGMPTDPEIARDAVAALKVELPLDWETIKPIVKAGHITLEGTVEWHNQRQRAEAVVAALIAAEADRVMSLSEFARQGIMELPHASQQMSVAAAALRTAAIALAAASEIAVGVSSPDFDPAEVVKQSEAMYAAFDMLADYVASKRQQFTEEG